MVKSCVYCGRFDQLDREFWKGTIETDKGLVKTMLFRCHRCKKEWLEYDNKIVKEFEYVKEQYSMHPTEPKKYGRMYYKNFIRNKKCQARK